MNTVKLNDVYGQEVSINIDDIVTITPCKINGEDAIVVFTKPYPGGGEKGYYLRGLVSEFIMFIQQARYNAGG